MKSPGTIRYALSLAVAGAALAFGANASAQQTTSSAGAPQPATTTITRTSEETDTGYMPDRYMLMSGLVLFGVPYVSSVIVASESQHYGDNELFVPLIGPWLDFANRGGCPAGSCSGETTNKVLLGVDGVFQALGVLQIVSALVMPETRSVTTVKATAYTPAVTVSPAKIGTNGYGLFAVAVF